MSDYCIWLYKDSDYNTVRDLFAKGTIEHTLVFLFLLLTIGSVPLFILAETLAIVGLWLGTRDIYHSYIQHALSDDMLDIHKYYPQRDGYCFWVAESAGEVVGTVAALPPPDPGGEHHMEFRRMSVSRSHRGKGIAKVLCRTVIDFARECGCEAVILETRWSYLAAQSLYESVGFKYQRSSFVKHSLAKGFDFMFLLYKYDIPIVGR
ncbi:hypothetical protein FKM82_019076 [Ascaphus truei]